MPLIHDGPEFERPVKRVYTKEAWEDELTYRANIKPLTSRRATNPEVSRATLLYQTGNLLRPGDMAYQFYFPFDLNDHYVVLSSQHPGEPEVGQWVGVIRRDTLAVDRKDILSGDQTFYAYGLEDVLDKAKIYKSRAVHDDIEQEIRVWPTFNERRQTGLGVKGNRTNDEVSDGYHAFSSDGAEWNALQFLQRMLYENEPSGITWEFSGQKEELEAIIDVWTVPPGMSCKELLDMVINRRRGLKWQILTDATAGAIVYLNVRTIVGADIVYGDKTLHANSNCIPFNLAVTYPLTHLVDVVPLERTTADRYDKLIIQGQPVKVCCTFSFLDSNLEAGWADELQTAYESSGQDENGRRDDIFRDVFQKICVVKTWNFESAGAEFGMMPVNVSITPNEDGTFDETTRADGRIFHKSFLGHTPFQSGKDYTEDPVLDRNPEGTEPDFVPLMVFLKNADDEWFFAEHAGLVEDGATSINVRTLDGELGVQLHCTYNHALGKGHFSGTSSLKELFDYETMAITAMFELDVRQQIVIELSETPHENERTRVITIPNCEYWWVAPNTAVGILAADRTLLDYSVHKVLRNDLEKLEAVAAFAAHWYSQERQPITITVKDIGRFFEPLDFMTDLNFIQSSTEINCICTAVSINWERFETTIETDDVSFDSFVDMSLVDL